MKQMILGDMSGYIANRAWESDDYRLDTAEVEAEIVSVIRKPSSLPVLAGLGSLVQGFYRSVFSSKTVEESKVRP